MPDNTGTNQYSAGVSYNFSKRTLVYLYYTRQDNDANARFRYGTNTGPVAEQRRGRCGSASGGSRHPPHVLIETAGSRTTICFTKIGRLRAPAVF